MLFSVLVAIFCIMSKCKFLWLVIDGAKGCHAGQSENLKDLTLGDLLNILRTKSDTILNCYSSCQVD